MQPTPGILLGQHFRQALLEKHADRHMLLQGDARLPCTDFSSNGPEGCPRIGGQACTGSTFAGRCGKLGEQQFP